MNATPPPPRRRRLVFLVGLPPHLALALSLAARRTGDRVEPLATVREALGLLSAVIPDEVIVATEAQANQLRPELARVARPGLNPHLQIDVPPVPTAQAS